VQVAGKDESIPTTLSRQQAHLDCMDIAISAIYRLEGCRYTGKNLVHLQSAIPPSAFVFEHLLFTINGRNS